MRRIELAVVAAALVAATAFWALVPTYPSLDSYYALVWGREAFGGHTPSFDGYRAPTHHPLWVLGAGVLSLGGGGGGRPVLGCAGWGPVPFSWGGGCAAALAGGDADRLLVLVAMWCLVLFLWGMYRLATGQFGPWVGLVSALFAASSFAFLLYAVRAFVDVPFLAAVVWAGALGVGRWALDRGPRRSAVPAMALLAVAGLLRPEAWILAALWWLWTVRGSRQRFALTALALAAPVLWLASDVVITGDALFSFHRTSALADELRHTGGAAPGPGAPVSYLAGPIPAPAAPLRPLGAGPPGGGPRARRP